MNPISQGYDTGASLVLPVKRGRGRPKKNQNQDVGNAPLPLALPPPPPPPPPPGFGPLPNLNVRYMPPPPPPGFYLRPNPHFRHVPPPPGFGPPTNVRSPNSGIPPPPGFEGAKRKRFREVTEVHDNNNIVDQAVAGFIEADFGAGYVINVKIGNSNTNLRGVVFKLGHSVPAVTKENHVAPQVPLIKRGSTTAGTQGTKHTCISPKMASSAHPVGTRGTVVPVILRPVNLSTGESSSAIMPSYASKAADMLLLNESEMETIEPSPVLPPIFRNRNGEDLQSVAFLPHLQNKNYGAFAF